MQFDQLQNFRTTHYGVFWERVREDYPNSEDRPPLGDVIEPVEGGPLPERIGETYLETPPLRRVFYVNNSGEFLLQLQPSRFLTNWRRMRAEDEYPRFGPTFERFIKGWRVLNQFLTDSELGVPRANQYELTYINHIVDSEGFPSRWNSYLRAAPWPPDAGFLPSPAGVGVQLAFRLPDNKGALRVSSRHGTRDADKQPVLVLEVTARGPASSDATDLNDWFSVAHEWIVRGFADLTTREAHESWERLE